MSAAIELETHAPDAPKCIPVGAYRIVRTLGITRQYGEPSPNLRGLGLAEGLMVGARKRCFENVDLHRMILRMTVFALCERGRMSVTHAPANFECSPPMTLTSVIPSEG